MKQFLAQRLRAIDASLVHLAATLRGLVLWPVLVAMAVGSSLWALTHRSRIGALASNKLHEAERTQMLWALGFAAAGVLVLYAAAVIVRRLRARRWRVVHTMGWLNRLLCFTLALPLLVALAAPKVETDSPKLVLCFALLAAAVCAPTLVALAGIEWRSLDAGPPPWRRRLEQASRWLVPLAVVALWLAYTAFFADQAITNHHAFRTRTIDLGYYDNIFWQSAHGNPLGCKFIRAEYHGSAHFDPILVLLSPLYLLYPRAEFLLVLQSAWVGSAVIPIYLLGRRGLDSRLGGLVLAAVYALYPAVHGANMYEFHSLTLLATPLCWLLYFLETESLKRYWGMLVVVLLVREDAALVCCFIGGYALLSRRPRLTRLGWVTILVSLSYFAIVKRFFMTSVDIFMGGPEAYSFAYYYRDLIPSGTGMRGLATSLATNPAFVIEHMFTNDKVIFLGVLLVPLLVLPLWAKTRRFMLLYGLVFLLLATRKPVYSPYFQYSAVLVPFLFALTPAAIRRIEGGRAAGWLGLSARQLRAALLGGMLVAAALVSWKFGGILENKRFRGGFSTVVRELSEADRTKYAEFREIIDQIPADASVTVTNIVGPHLSNRRDVYFYRQKRRTEYVVVHERDLKGDTKGWHRRRVQRKELVSIGSVGQIKAFKVQLDGDPVPSKDDADKKPPTKPSKDARKPRKNTFAPGRIPPGRLGELAPHLDDNTFAPGRTPPPKRTARPTAPGRPGDPGHESAPPQDL